MAQTLGGCELSFGIAGWSYPDWEGIVYPPGTRDRLRWLAGFVDLIEVNATFYGFLAPATAEDWLARTADLPGFRFAAKAHRAFTHQKPGAAGPAEARAAKAFLEPFRREGRLAAFLLQFPFSFHDGPAARERLTRLADAFRGFPMVVELRHESWQTAATLELLRDFGMSVANLDMPCGSRGLRPKTLATGEPGYLRLHGRNAVEWFRREATRDARYDYLYGDDELDEIAGRIEELAGRFRQLVIVTNNHYRGQALANLAELAARAGAAPAELPESLILTYPRLRAVARPAAPPVAAGAQPEAPAGLESAGPRPQRDLFEDP